MDILKIIKEVSDNNNLHSARKVKNDEFYTMLTDIEKELAFYKKWFKGKIIFLNCDDPAESNFFLYFVLNFKFLGLKKIIATHFEPNKPSYALVVDKDINNDGVIDLKDAVTIPLTQSGDFRSPECIEFLKEADIVVTNPPFSLFREYVGQLIEYKKKFLIIGNQNALTYKETFKLIKDGKIWLGITYPKKFTQPDRSMKKFGNICWFTNISHKKRNEELILYKFYKGNEKDYPSYDNYDAIEVSKVKDIPADYYDAMGVPITFLNAYNPKQFEILGLMNDKRIEDDAFIQGKPVHLDEQHKKFVGAVLNGKAPYARIIIKQKKVK